MKKWIAALAALMLLSCPMTAFAEGADVNQVSGNQGIEVYGSCQSSKDYYEIMLGVDGMDTVELPDSITLGGKSDSKADDELRVVIIPVTADEEKEAYAWMVSAAAELGKEPTVYYLAFYRGNTPVQPEGKVTITVTAKDGYEKAKLYYMDGNAEAKEVSYTREQKNVSFGMEQTGYYLLVKTEDSQQPATPTDPSNPSKPTTPGTPQTGDNSNIWLWLVIMILSFAGLVVTMLPGKRERKYCNRRIK